MSPTDTLIVFALRSEAQNLFDAYPVLFTGVGKVNAAYRLMERLGTWKEEHGKFPSLVINLGSAGSNLFRRESVINCTQFIQRDMDVTAFGHTRFTTPDEDESPVFSAGLRQDGFPQGVCGSGDNFSTDGKTQGWNVVDMEAYALAKVCTGQNVPFCCMKFISDGADGAATADWDETVAKAAKALHDALLKIAP